MIEHLVRNLMQLFGGYFLTLLFDAFYAILNDQNAAECSHFLVTQYHRRSQDFLWSAIFLKKIDDCFPFSVFVLNITQAEFAKTAKLTTSSKKIQKIDFLLCLGGKGGTYNLPL